MIYARSKNNYVSTIEKREDDKPRKNRSLISRGVISTFPVQLRNYKDRVHASLLSAENVTSTYEIT